MSHSDLRKIIAENEAKYTKKREKWHAEIVSLKAEIEKYLYNYIFILLYFNFLSFPRKSRQIVHISIYIILFIYFVKIRLKKDKQELRKYQKKADFLLDKYRAQLRSYVQDGTFGIYPILIVSFFLLFSFPFSRSPPQKYFSSFLIFVTLLNLLYCRGRRRAAAKRAN